jgi:hypothetical protein
VRVSLKGTGGGGPRRWHVVRRGGGGGPTWRLEFVGDGHRWQQAAGPRDVAAAGGGQWLHECGSGVWRWCECGQGCGTEREREREREREAGGEGERVMVFWLSHVSFISRLGPMEIVVRSSIGYLKPTEITVSFVGRLRLTEIVVPSSVGYLNLTEITVSFIDQLRQTEVVVLSSVFREANGNYFSR